MKAAFKQYYFVGSTRSKLACQSYPRGSFVKFLLWATWNKRLDPQFLLSSKPLRSVTVLERSEASFDEYWFLRSAIFSRTCAVPFFKPAYGWPSSLRHPRFKINRRRLLWNNVKFQREDIYDLTALRAKARERKNEKKKKMDMRKKAKGARGTMWPGNEREKVRTKNYGKALARRVLAF